MTPRGFAWVFNLDADYELARGRRYTTPAKLRADLERHGAAARALMGPEDVELPYTTERLSAEVRGRAWCPTPRALARMRAAGVTPEPSPEVAILRRCNHRRFAVEIGGGLPNQRYVETGTALDETIARPGPWLLKRPFSFAGRGQHPLLGPPGAKERAWIDKSLAEDGLVVEPLVTPLLEVSLHGFIWQSQRYELGRMCVQEVSARGVYHGARLAAPGELQRSETHALFSTAERVAGALVAAGYFGPFGIDAYRYEDGFCALGEINARYTMAFAIGFPRPALATRH